MPVTAIVGANWGDEGKGKIADCLAADADVVVRFQGGRNAGHTIINEHGRFALHLLPAGVFFPDVVNVLGPGVALDAPALLRERDDLIARGVPDPRLAVSDRAQVVMPYHALLDACEEERLGDRQFGSTRTGIAPFYADKCLKTGLQAADLFEPARVRACVDAALAQKNILLAQLYGRPALSSAAVADSLLESADALRPHVCDTSAFLRDAMAAGRRVVLEGQLGALRDPDHGIHPFTTSSSTLAGFAAVGAGIPPAAITRVIAVTKAYSTCVGAGPFVTELTGREAEDLRTRGGDAGEYGATTGRPRRVGWFDAVATRYGCRIQGATEVALTALDVLGYLDEIPLCTAYEVDGGRSGSFPRTPILEQCRPVYERLPGWRRPIAHVRELAALPREARAFIDRVEELIECPIRWISTGPSREALIRR